MEFVQDFINTYGSTIIYTILTAIAGYVGIVIKNIYHKYVDDKTKKEVVKTCVLAIEQIYTELHGREKLDKCLEYASEILNEKGVFITDIELRLLIESAVKEFNYRFNSDNDNIDEEAGE